MYRLLFTTKDNLHQLTVITDGIDSQLNVFVTENTVGDVDYFESLGIVIRAGLTYNIGQFKEWATNNILRLIAYPEEYEGKEQILVDIVEDMRYFLIPQDETMQFPKEGDNIEAVVTSYKQLYVNGKPQGGQTPLEVDFETKSPYTVSKSGTVTIAENPTTSVRNGVLTVTQHESNKKITINLTQEASTVSYTYNLTIDPNSLSFANTGETKKITVTSTKQVIINGKPSGNPTNIGTHIEVAGAGFSYSAISDGFNIKAEENPGNTQRTGKITITMDEGGKSATVNLTQAASVITYEYSLLPTPTNISFAAAGESKSFNVVSVKQKKLNGNDSGSPVNVGYTTTVSGAGFTKGSNDTTVVAAENTAESQRTGKVTISAVEGGKTAEITLTQAASVITYEYSLLPTPTNISFAAAGESKSFNVVSVKQKKLNGNDSGSPVNVGYTTTVSGAGFTKGSNDTTVVAAENTAESQRTGKVTISAVEGGKTAEITLTQAAAVVTYEYELTVDPTSLQFIAAGETKIFSVLSKKQKKINGKVSGLASAVNYTTTVTGEGFSKGDSEYSVIAANNTGSQRTGQAKVAASEGGKTITVTLTQAGV